MKETTEIVQGLLQKAIQEIPKAKKDPYKDIFLKKIGEYNKTRDFFTHFILLKDGNLMVIEFRNSWEYFVVTLEEE